MRINFIRAGILIGLVCGLATSARAQGFQVERYEPTPAGSWFHMVNHPWYSSTRWFAGGFTLDSDCGTADSGRICDLTGNHKCKAGCRNLGGNGCPTGQICNGAGALPGQCVEPNDLAMNIPDSSVEPVDMSVPIDMTQTNFKLTGGGLGCGVGGSAENTSLGSLLLLLLALVAVRPRRRAR